MPKTAIPDQDLELVTNLIEFLRSVPRHTNKSALRIHEARSMQRLRARLQIAQSATEEEREAQFLLSIPRMPGVPDFPPEATSGREVVRPHDNDLRYHCSLVHDAIQGYRDEAYDPPPYYARRIAIILRKGHQYQIEVDFLRECTRLYGEHWFKERAVKARELMKRKAT